MKHFFALLATVLILTSVSTNAAEAVWLTDYDVALKKAAVEKKTLLLNFTGSDWCGWCKKLDKEVFSQPEFTAYAANNNIVLVKVDFPRKKSQPEAEKIQNTNLKKKYKIEGYPTIVVMNSAGNKIGELGYNEGGAKPWIAELKKVIMKRAK